MLPSPALSLSRSTAAYLKLNPLGDLLSLLAALVWAFYSVLIKQISAQGSSMLVVTRKVFTYGLLFLLPLLPLFDFRLDAGRLLVLPNLLNLLFLGAGASALCYITWNSAVRILGPVKTSVYIYMVPVVAILVLGAGAGRDDHPDRRDRHGADPDRDGAVRAGEED